MEFRILKTVNELLEIENDYNKLLESIEEKQIFYEFNWLKNYILYYPGGISKDNELCIVVGYQDKKLLLLCPFCFEKNILRFICRETNDYNTILIDSSINRYSVLKDVLVFISSQIKFKKIVLATFSYSDILLNLSILANNKNYKSFIKMDSIAPFSLLQRDNEKFNKKQIADIRRRLKKLNAEHEVRFEDSNTLTEFDLSFITQKKDESFGQNIFTDKKAWQFFLQTNKDLNEKFLINRMYVDEKLVAIHFGFQDEKKVYY